MKTSPLSQSSSLLSNVKFTALKHIMAWRTKSYSIDQQSCCGESGFNGNYVEFYFVSGAAFPLVLTQPLIGPSWEGIWAREQFRRIGNLSHYPLPLIYYVCSSWLEGGQISIVWKFDKLLCLHQSNKKGESQRESWKNPPRNRSCSVTHSMGSRVLSPAESSIKTQLILATVVK